MQGGQDSVRGASSFCECVDHRDAGIAGPVFAGSLSMGNSYAVAFSRSMSRANFVIGIASFSVSARVKSLPSHRETL